MPRAPVLPLCLLAALGCGAPPGGAQLSAAIALVGIAPSDVAAVQLTVLSNGQRFNCDQIKRSCLAQQIDPSKDAVPLRGPDGNDHRALRFSLSGDKLLGAGDTATLELAPGTNYLIVAEVLASAGPGWLLASGCEVRQDLTSGDNAGLTIVATPLVPIPSCDPHID